MIKQNCIVCNNNDIIIFTEIENKKYWRCNTCLCTFIDPAHFPAPNFEHERYLLHNNNLHDNEYRKFLSKLSNPLINRLDKNLNGLDYGCGPGPLLAQIMTEAGHNISLYDPFFYPEINVLNQKFDFITCSEVFEHFHNPALELSKLNNLLKDGGLIAIMTGFQSDDKNFDNWYYRKDPTHVVFYKEETFNYIANLYEWVCEIIQKDVVIMKKHPINRNFN